ncbi:NADH-ubiquinone oxidoreductase-F iron-sulfur binding region domain-containing protein [Peptostreptococcaceae bacterium AGR-M142]
MDFLSLRKKYIDKLEFRRSLELPSDTKTSDEDIYKDSSDIKHILVCSNTNCNSKKAKELIAALNKEIVKANKINSIKVIESGCFGLCEKGPIVKIYPDNIYYINVDVNDSKEIIHSHLIMGNIIDRLLFKKDNQNIKDLKSKTKFFSMQNRFSLTTMSLVNPNSIEEAIAYSRYYRLYKFLKDDCSYDIFDYINKYSIKDKKRFKLSLFDEFKSLKESPNDNKFLICDCCENDPNSFLNRSLIEGIPHSIIEGIILCGVLTNTNKAYIYIKYGYTLALKRIKKALLDAKKLNLLGDNILNSSFSFDIEIKYSSIDFSYGNGSGIINSIRGNRGEPILKDYSFDEKNPHMILDVETMCNLSNINIYSDYINTKVITLFGSIKNSGLLEIPLDLSFNDLIFDMGNANKNDIKGILVGGFNGFYVNPKDFHLNLNDILDKCNLGIDISNILVLDNNICMVNFSKYYLKFMTQTSCGKCSPCRIGSKRIFNILDKISKGHGTLEDLNLISNIASSIIETSLCDFGKISCNPIISILENCYDEFYDHIINKNCIAHKCSAFLNYFISDKCIGCTKCVKTCPTNSIYGAIKKIHKINLSTCIDCGICEEICPVDAVIKK